MKKLTRETLVGTVAKWFPFIDIKPTLTHFLGKCIPPDPNTLLSQAIEGNPQAQEALAKPLYGLAQTFIETHDDEKKATLRAAANSYMRTPTAPDVSPSIMTDAYLRWVREMNPIHLKLLAGAKDLKRLRETATAITGGRYSPYAMGGETSINGQTVETHATQWEHLDAGRPGPMSSVTAAPHALEVERCWDDLYDKDLVTLKSKYIFQEAKLTDKGMDHDLRTGTGIKFLNYLGVETEWSRGK
ncbi:MAG: hypothetical protein OXJ53_05590 [Gammaproteobacteria bacterium]|nr:hypothetical protein [Gammaproteobacteria bacterium]MDE0273536.1 hypothetical protein [Gammaproteobacteria bacterium]